MKNAQFLATLFLFSATLAACTFDGNPDYSNQESDGISTNDSFAQKQPTNAAPTSAPSKIVAVTLPRAAETDEHAPMAESAEPPSQPHNGTSLNGLFSEDHGA